jgi:hypothetical protein
MSSRGAKRSVDDDSLLGGDAKRAILHAEQVGRLHASGTLLVFLDAALRESMLPMFDLVDVPMLHACDFLPRATIAAWILRHTETAKMAALLDAISVDSVDVVVDVLKTIRAKNSVIAERYAFNTVGHAVSCRRLRITNAMLVNGVNPSLVLWTAIQKGNCPGIIATALLHGANPNMWTHSSNYDATPLVAAIMNGCSHSDIEVLLDAGADVNAPTYYRASPLHIAVLYTRSDIVRLLLDRGADVNNRQAIIGHPIHMAVLDYDKDPRCFMMLIADPNFDVLSSFQHGGAIPRNLRSLFPRRRSVRLAAQ